MNRLAVIVACLAGLTGCWYSGDPRAHIASDIAAELEHTKSIDNHAHPMKVVGADEVDRDFDALPADAVQDPAMPVAAQPDNPMFSMAWKDLFGYDHAALSMTGSLPGLVQAKAAAAKMKGDSYPIWILNHTNTEIMLANRVAMGRGLSNDRFKWVPFVDMFLFPLNNASIKQKDTEHAAFIKNEEQLLEGYLDRAQLKAPPLALDDYLVVISHTLEKFKSDGAVALKFEMAYLRDLEIGNPKKEDVERIYTIYVQQPSEPSAEEYRAVEDYLFRYIAQEAGRLNLPIHIHTSLGVGSYFRAANANPLALEPLFNDPGLRKTKFVMLHGAWPFTREAAALILKPNVYVDYSAWSYLTFPHQAANDLRLLLEAAPEKVLYGSDASPFSQNVGWEETAWTGAKFGRQVLGQAVSAMIDDGEINTERGKHLVHLVLRENARQLYGF
jgi:uncharacterized protein